ncbi:hypothetical protein C8Q80DRAFT_1262578 [Daedaleopsis nitida]|nr:hypothetical protein C8Q80DRAFT_1262578 [Daedaleopsis nitida]
MGAGRADTSGLIQGTKLVGVGHAAGAVICSLTTWGYALDRLPYSSLILTEPSMHPRGLHTPQLPTWTAVMAAVSHLDPNFDTVYAIQAVNEPEIDATKTPGYGNCTCPSRHLILCLPREHCL